MFDNVEQFLGLVWASPIPLPSSLDFCQKAARPSANVNSKALLQMKKISLFTSQGQTPD